MKTFATKLFTTESANFGRYGLTSEEIDLETISLENLALSIESDFQVIEDGNQAMDNLITLEKMMLEDENLSQAAVRVTFESSLFLVGLSLEEDGEEGEPVEAKSIGQKIKSIASSIVGAVKGLVSKVSSYLKRLFGSVGERIKYIKGKAETVDWDATMEAFDGSSKTLKFKGSRDGLKTILKELKSAANGLSVNSDLTLKMTEETSFKVGNLNANFTFNKKGIPSAKYSKDPAIKVKLTDMSRDEVKGAIMDVNDFDMETFSEAFSSFKEGMADGQISSDADKAETKKIVKSIKVVTKSVFKMSNAVSDTVTDTYNLSKKLIKVK